jgi:transposase
VRAQCTRGAEGVRKLSFPPAAEYRALQAARAYQATPEFKSRYNVRAGIEGTLSQGIAALGLRVARYWGLAKTRLQHLLVATAMDYLRIADWLMEVPRATTRTSKLLKFAAVASL